MRRKSELLVHYSKTSEIDPKQPLRFPVEVAKSLLILTLWFALHREFAY